MAAQSGSDLAVKVFSTSDGVPPPTLQWAHKYRGVSTSSCETTVQLNSNNNPSLRRRSLISNYLQLYLLLHIPLSHLPYCLHTSVIIPILQLLQKKIELF
jgi:hypothetical protein